MTREQLTKLFRRRQPLTPELSAALEQLAHLVETRPALVEAAELQGAMLRLLASVQPRVEPPSLTQAQAASRLEGGMPLLRNTGLPLQVSAVEALLLELCRLVRRHQGDAGTAAAIELALQRQALQVEPLVRAVLGGQVGVLHERAAELDLDAALLGTLLRFSLFTALERLAAQLAPLRAAAPWSQGYCPTCGSWPLLGEYRGLEQTRFLRCGLCASEWPVERLVCPFCQTRRHEDLSYLQVAGEEQQRVITCDGCHGYLKMVTTLAPIPGLALPVQDLATLHLDLIALERGYSAPV